MCLAIVTSWETAISNWAGSFGWPMESALRLVLAVICGGLVGMEREIRGREAGFRTYILVCLGSALVMLVSIEFAEHRWIAQTPNLGVNINVDPARIAYGVMTGVGFLGAGTILHNRGSIRGLTTAAGLWCAAAIGLASGFGMYTMTIISTVLVLLALSVLNYCEDFLPRIRYRRVTLRVPWTPHAMPEFVARFKKAGLIVPDATFQRLPPDLTIAEVQLYLGFKRMSEYHAFILQFESDPAVELISMTEA